MARDLHTLDPLASLFAAERRRPDATVGALRDRLQATLGLDLGGPGPSDAPPPADAPLPVESAPPAPDAIGGSAIGTASTVGTIGNSASGSSIPLVVKLVSTLVVGIAIGAGGHRLLTPASVELVPIARPSLRAPVLIVVPSSDVATPASPLASAGTSVDLDALPPAIAADPANPSGAAPATAGRETDLARERSILQRGNAALARGRADDALAAVDEHAASFPSGQLVPERELLARRARDLAASSEPPAK